jgi:hypothetical protein
MRTSKAGMHVPSKAGLIMESETTWCMRFNDLAAPRAGCVAGWRQRQQADPGTLPARVEAAVASLEALLARMALNNPKVCCYLLLLAAAHYNCSAVLAVTAADSAAQSFSRPQAAAWPDSRRDFDSAFAVQDESLLEVLEAMRGKFKTIVAMLGTAEAYASKDPPPAAAAAALDF